MKKILAVAVLGLLVGQFLLTNFALAQDVELPISDPAGLQRTGLCGEGIDVRTCIANIFAIVFKVLIYVAGALAVIMFVWAGLEYILHAEKADRAKNRLIWGTIGLVIALVSYVLVQLIQRFTSAGALEG
jgi:hypothetical protein